MVFQEPTKEKLKALIREEILAWDKFYEPYIESERNDPDAEEVSIHMLCASKNALIQLTHKLGISYHGSELD